jgi:superfamily II DNA or RNA helicase
MGDKVILTNKAWIPEHLCDIEKVKKNYLIRRYEEVACAQCEFKSERHYYVCDTCAAFKGKYRLYEKKVIDGKNYIGLHIGDKLNMIKKAGLPKDVFNNLEDNRSEPKLKQAISFVGKLRSYQKDARAQWLEHKYGQLMAPPRSGKTILAVKLTLDLKVKTLILTHQGDLLTQMLNSFYEFTDIKELEFDQRKEFIGIAKKPEDFKKWPIVLSTYQKFITDKGKKRLSKLVRKFGLVIIDEVHRANADAFSQVLSQFESKYKLGFTATPKRKDRKEFLIEHIIGPVTSKVEPEQIKPKLVVHYTGATPKYEYKTWVPAMQFLARDKKRMEMIANLAVKDVINGHHIVIPVVFVKQAQALTDLINKKLYAKTGKAELALAFTSKIKDREKALEKIRAGKIKVTVGIRSLIQAGINVPRWSALYEISPISNRPNFQQETARVRTPAPELNKPQPLIRFFLDENMGMCKGCFGTCWQDLKEFDMSDKTREKALTILSKLNRFRKDKEYDVDAIKVDRIIDFSSSQKESKPRGVGFMGLNTAYSKR